MQTITGKAVLAGGSNVASLATLGIQERFSKKYAGNVLFNINTDIDGNFSFQVRPGAYYLRYGNDAVPFLVRESAGSTTIDQLIETV